MLNKRLSAIILIAVSAAFAGCSSNTTEHHFAPDGSHRLVIYGDESDTKIQQTLAKFNKSKILYRHVKTDTTQGEKEYRLRRQQTGFRGNGFPVIEIDKNMPLWCNAATGSVPSNQSVATIKKFLSEPKRVCYKIPYLWKVPCPP